MQPSLGEYIRHLRRERGMTQTELGDGRYSKSYVSALERGSIVPSRDALHYLAEQLAQPVELFEHMLRQEQQEHAYLHSSAVPELKGKTYEQENQQEVAALFNLILSGTNPSAMSLAREVIVPDVENREALPLIRQARTAFLQGLIAQETGDLRDAEHSFEQALALVPVHQQAAILDALGTNSYLRHMYSSAIYYHRRALHSLQPNTTQEQHSDLPLLIELHCGHDYRALALHDQARDHYERARRHLRPTHHLLLAAQLYLGLGYCTYAALYQHLPANGNIPQFAEEDERVFQRAISFLLQSRALYQASHDTVGVTRARLSQAMILLDFCTWQQQAALERARTNQTRPAFTYTSLLGDVEEQCHQILMEWQENFSSASTLPKEVEVLLYSTLSSLVRFGVQRAELARLGSYESTAMRDLSQAADLCQKMMNTLGESTFPWPLVQQALVSPGSTTISASPALPRMPDTTSSEALPRDVLCQAEVYWAAGCVAEEMGRSVTTGDFASSCYKQADQYLQMALRLLLQGSFDQERDSSYLVRYYQRYISYLRERVNINPEMMEETYPVLLKLLNELLFFIHNNADSTNKGE